MLRASTAVKVRAFLAAYRRTCNITQAAKAAGIDPRRHYAWLNLEGYKELFRKATVVAGDYLEGVAVERATLGWKEPIYYQGKRVGYVRRFDSGLLQFLLRGAKPDKYRERTEITGKDGAPIKATLEVVFLKPPGAV